MSALLSADGIAGVNVGMVRTDRGRRIEISREIEAPAATVWTLFTDVRYWPEWGPPVTDVETPETTISGGTTGRVQAFGVLWVPFRIEALEESLWTWSVRGLTPPADGHRVDELGPDRCRAVLELPLWAPWYLPLCWVALRNIAKIARQERG
jgi:hypothetical protein